jgi:hypothetical protein
MVSATSRGSATIRRPRIHLARSARDEKEMLDPRVPKSAGLIGEPAFWAGGVPYAPSASSKTTGVAQSERLHGGVRHHGICLSAGQASPTSARRLVDRTARLRVLSVVARPSPRCTSRTAGRVPSACTQPIRRRREDCSRRTAPRSGYLRCRSSSLSWPGADRELPAISPWATRRSGRPVSSPDQRSTPTIPIRTPNAAPADANSHTRQSVVDGARPPRLTSCQECPTPHIA